MASPPSLRISFGSSSAVLPAPITTRRATLSPSGTISSSAEPLLPVKRSVLAARATRPAADPSALAVARPNLSPSSQNTMRTPDAPIWPGRRRAQTRASGHRTSANPYPGDIGGLGILPAIWPAPRPSAKPQIARFPGFSPRPAAGPLQGRCLPPDMLARDTSSRPDSRRRFLLFVVHVQRVCHCAATLWRDQGKPDGGWD